MNAPDRPLPDSGLLADALALLSNPGPDFRGMPFWSWNARLEPSRLREQIRLFRDMGFGGFFMHSREGLATEYLGKDWFDCVRACADEASKLGIRAWAYDEDRWPSGTAGGLVTIPKRYRNRSLAREEAGSAEAAAPGGKVVAWFAEKPAPRRRGAPDGAPIRLASYRRIAGPATALQPGEKAVRYAVRVADGQPRFNGGAYLDVLSAAAVREFVRTTHDAYARELGASLSQNGVVPGFFTDEPNIVSAVPWTASLPREYRKRFGVDLLDRLPELFAVVGGEAWSETRWRYREVVTSLFVSAYAGTIGRWCVKHGVVSTGHVLAEDTPTWQSDRAGSAMRFYEQMQGPGIDWLTERWLPLLTAKQCASVARQTGRQFRMCEIYGCTGWDFPLEGHAALADELLALGVNHRVHHLAWYSMPGRVKRDYPASISFQSPWHGRYAAVEDRFARAATLAGAGGEPRELLVVHPGESVWGARVAWSDQPEMSRKDDAATALVSNLLGQHIDFDFGDEEMLSRLGRVRGVARGAAPLLRVGKASYRAVLLPASLETLRGSTVALLRDFAAAGGALFALGRAPSRVDARPSDAAVSLWRAARRMPADVQASGLSAELSPAARRFSLSQDGEECAAALVHERAWRDGAAYFVCNVSAPLPLTVKAMIGGFPQVRDRDIEYPRAVLRVPAPAGAARVVEIDLATGRAEPVAAKRDGGAFVIPCALGRIQSRLFAVLSGSAEASAPALDVQAKKSSAPFVVRPPRAGMEYSLDQPNDLVLDWAQWRAQSGVEGEGNVLQADRAVRVSLGLPGRGDKPWQPWAVEAGIVPPLPDSTTSVTLRFRFRVARGASALPREVAVERPELRRVVLNGVPLAVPRRAQWWIDPCITRLPVPAGVVKEGVNELVVETPAFGAKDSGFEAVHVLGAFAVARGDRADAQEIRPLPATLRMGDLGAQGLPTYGGNVEYKFRAKVPVGRPVRLVPGRFAGAAVELREGEKGEFVHVPPYEAVFPARAKEGERAFSVVLYGSRRNQLGPFYLEGGVRWPTWSGNAELDSFATAPKRTFVPFGLGCNPRSDA